ncbi:MAG: hypothetical protein HQL97_07410 [Magnetococcales bacterium]|nr:hypothetical protein [Magnetococcales bacterium]MBF0261639.1 hypothetical protein [Magnetococcales bacterium]
MDRFARLFTLQFQLGEPANRNSLPIREEQWRVIDRTIVLFGPPAIVNHAWSPGMMDLLFTGEDETSEALLD